MEEVINSLANSLNFNIRQIKEVLALLEEGATIPFIARYRKERTGGLTEEELRSIEEAYKYQVNLYNRKEDIIRLIDEKGMLSEEIKASILMCTKLVEVEDIYLPYKEKKKTKATEAIKMGLEPLAKAIMLFPKTGSLEELCKPFDMDKDTALEGAGYIISEIISETFEYRKWIREFIMKDGVVQSKKKKDAKDEGKIYEIYYDFNEKLSTIKHYRVLAINRGEKEKVLTVSILSNMEFIESFLQMKFIKDHQSFVVPLIKNCIKDSLKRLIMPSVIREIRNELTESAEKIAINTFSTNLEHLLMTRPLKKRNVLGFDPAFRTGCKLAVLDNQGNLMDIAVIYPHEPKKDYEGSKKKMLELIEKYKIDLIAIGNGTASRESESFVASVIKGLNVKYIITSEAGASVYSASPLAKSEFPELSVEQRSAISIGRRIQDPLSELVKIEPKSIGVGEYQHDVNAKELSESLEFTVTKVVNEVGVNINTASPSILRYISGMTKGSIAAISKYKEKKEFASRRDIEELKGVTSKIYEQAIGFLRISDGDNILDKTGIHPESYNLTMELLNKLNLDIININTEDFKKTLESANPDLLAQTLNSDSFTLRDIIKELLNPGLDPRDELVAPILKSNILELSDLRVGMELEGTVRNVASFGAFIDIGLHNDALIHISKMSKSFVNNPSDILSVGDIITCFVDNIDMDKGNVSLTLLK